MRKNERKGLVTGVVLALMAAAIAANAAYAPNDAPVAMNDFGTTMSGQSVEINVVANDTDSDGSIDETKVDINTDKTGVQHSVNTPPGNWDVNSHGIVKFTPKVDFIGTAMVDYRVMDNKGAVSNEATITVQVTAVNKAPVAVDDTRGTTPGAAVDINVVANDTDSDGTIDPSTVDLNTQTAGVQNEMITSAGTWAVNNQGVVTFSPILLFLGNATLNYTVMDNEGAVSNVATIKVSVSILNQAPIASNDNGETTINTPTTINIVANDFDPDGTIDATQVDLDTDTNGVQNTDNTAQGNWTVTDRGVVTYTPVAGFLGNATLTYTVTDNKGAVSNKATINITVKNVESGPGPNEAPVISAFESDSLRYSAGHPIRITDLFDVTDADDDSLAIAEIGFAPGTYTAATDKLMFSNMDPITGTFNPQNGLLKLTGRASIGEYVAAVRSVQYEFTGDAESHQVIKKIYVRVSDGKSFSNEKQRIIKVSSGVTELDIPTAFTPNSDGANDTWKILAPADITGSDFADAVIRIYDKQGTVVFAASGLDKAWDGTYQGKQLPVDTYYYTIDLKELQTRYRGAVAILR